MTEKGTSFVCCLVDAIRNHVILVFFFSRRRRDTGISRIAGVPALVIDNTMATQILCQPGKFGADLRPEDGRVGKEGSFRCWPNH